MAMINRIKQAQQPKAVTAVTGAAPQTVTGNTISIVGSNIEPGTLSATVYAKATVSTLTLTAKWQVSNDGVTFRDAYAGNKAANVAIATGTGSAVSDTVDLAAPAGAYGHLYARVIVVSGVGVGAGLASDEASISYNWRVMPAGVG